MGRTNATYRDLLRALEERWAPYRRGLRREDQAHFDQLFTHARNHADASGLRNHEEPIVPVLFSIALAQEKQLATLEARVETLEARSDPVEAPDEALATDPEGAR
jgi:BMFP domain-containing protein YqiC